MSICSLHLAELPAIPATVDPSHHIRAQMFPMHYIQKTDPSLRSSRAKHVLKRLSTFSWERRVTTRVNNVEIVFLPFKDTSKPTSGGIPSISKAYFFLSTRNRMLCGEFTIFDRISITSFFTSPISTRVCCEERAGRKKR